MTPFDPVISGSYSLYYMRFFFFFSFGFGFYLIEL